MDKIPYKSLEQKKAEAKRMNQKRYYAQKQAQEKQTAYRLKQMFREE